MDVDFCIFILIFTTFKYKFQFLLCFSWRTVNFTLLTVPETLSNLLHSVTARVTSVSACLPRTVMKGDRLCQSVSKLQYLTFSECRLRPVWLFRQFSCWRTKPHAEVSCLQTHTALTVQTVKIAALCRETLTHRCEPVWSNMILKSLLWMCYHTPSTDIITSCSTIHRVLCVNLQECIISDKYPGLNYWQIIHTKTCSCKVVWEFHLHNCLLTPCAASFCILG